MPKEMSVLQLKENILAFGFVSPGLMTYRLFLLLLFYFFVDRLRQESRKCGKECLTYILNRATG